MAKSPDAFRSISEAADEIGAPQHVLRFWEGKFPFIAPVKRAGGRRFYRPQDVVLLKAVKRLLHDEGMTIKGVQRLHKEQGLKRLAAYGDPDGAVALTLDGATAAEAAMAIPVHKATGRIDTSQLGTLLADLEQAKARLDAVLAR